MVAGLLRNQPRVLATVKEQNQCVKLLKPLLFGNKESDSHAFSTENWNRPKHEIKTLMKLLVGALKRELPLMKKIISDLMLLDIQI